MGPLWRNRTLFWWAPNLQKPIVFLWLLYIFVFSLFVAMSSSNFTYQGRRELILGTLRAIFKPSWGSLGTILGLFWGYLHHLGQRKLHVGLNLGQLGSILASGNQASTHRNARGRFARRLAIWPLGSLPPPSRALLVPFGPCWCQLGPL